MEEDRKQILMRIYILYGIMLTVGLIIIGRVIYLQFVEGDELEEKTRERTMAYKSIEAVRGSIYDENGHLLATSVPVFDIRMDVASPLIDDELFNAKVDSLARKLAGLFKDKHYRTYRSRLIKNRKAGNRFMMLKKNVTYFEVKKLRTFPILRRGKYKGGLIVISKSRRVLPFKKLASRTIGYKIKDYRVGLEGAYNHVLKGDSGRQLMQRIAKDVWMPVDQGNIVEPRNGNDIRTTLNVNIQDVAENALEEHLKYHKADHGCAVLMEVETGKIKAIANLKRDTATGKYKEVYNYAVGESTEPGSTFKIASLLVGLDQGEFDIDDSVNTGNGEIEYFGQKMEDSHDEGYGTITVERALEVSSNVGISKMIYKSYSSKPEKFVEGLQDMGLHKKLDIKIPGEGGPLIKTPEDETWSKVSLPWMSIGYEVEMTPLQILTLYNAIANKGKKMKPIFVKDIRNAGKVLKEFEPEVLNESIASEKTINELQYMLEGVVENGTAENLFNTVYNIAGKTGTAQIAQGSSGYDHSGHKASFVGYFPAEDPEYSCIVVVNKPAKGTYYGSAVAAPVFKGIADKVYATQLNIHEEKEGTKDPLGADMIAGYQQDFKRLTGKVNLPVKSANSPSEFVKPVKGDNEFRLNPLPVRSGYVPDVRGMGARDAIYLLERAGLNVQIFGQGKVESQSINPGTRVSEGRKIMIALGIK